MIWGLFQERRLRKRGHEGSYEEGEREVHGEVKVVCGGVRGVWVEISI